MNSKKAQSKDFSEIKDWFFFNRAAITTLITSVVFLLIYFAFTRGSRKVNLSDYTEQVELISIKYEKVNSLPALYSTEEKLDRIVFDLKYIYNNKVIESTTNVYWEYCTPKIVNILDYNQLEKLTVRCKKERPDQAMIFVKDEF